VVFDELTREDLVEILKNPNNPIIMSKRQDFRAYGIDIKFEDAALEKIAEMAARERTGARGLVSAIEKVLIPFEKHLPSTPVKRLVVTTRVVMNPEEELTALEKTHELPDRLERFEEAARRERENVRKFMAERVRDYEQRSGLEMYAQRLDLVSEIYSKVTSDLNTIFDEFTNMVRQIKHEEASLSQELDMNISFDDGAVDELIRKAVDTGREAGSVASQLVKKLEYGLKLVKDRSGSDLFLINREAVTDMERYINDLVKKYYREYNPESSN